MRGWDAGCVVLRGGRQCVKKDPATKLLVGLLQDYDDDDDGNHDGVGVEKEEAGTTVAAAAM
jgi:hypothetical protein